MDVAKMVVIATAMCSSWRSHQQTLFLPESFLKLVIMHFLKLFYLSCRTVFAQEVSEDKLISRHQADITP